MTPPPNEPRGESPSTASGLARRHGSGLVDLRPGEKLPVVRAFGLLALVIGAHTVMETARDALFLTKLPPSRLAFIYAAVAGIALIVARPNARFARRFGEKRSLLLTLSAGATGTFVFFLLPPTAPVVFSFYLWSALLSTIMVVDVWLFFADVFTASQGKRLFGAIGAGGVSGAILGAGAAAMALRFVHVNALLVGAAATFVLAALLTRTLPHGDTWSAATETSSRSTGTRNPTFVATRRHPYVGWLAALTAFSTAAVMGADYLFKSYVAHSVPRDSLGSYFAYCYLAFNSVALLVELVLAGLLVRRVGVARSALAMPTLLLASAAAVALTGAPAAVIATKGVDGSLRHSLHRLISEMLGLPMSPELRGRVKPLLDGALTRAMQAAMAGVILLLTLSGHASPRDIGWLVTALTIGWVITAVGMRRHYLDMFRRALRRGAVHTTRSIELDDALADMVGATIASAGSARALAAFDLLMEAGRADRIPVDVLLHPAEAVRLRGLDLMATAKKREWIAAAERLLGSSSERERIAAVRALADTDADATLRVADLDASPVVRAYAAVFRSRRSDDDPADTPSIGAILSAEGAEGFRGREALLDAIRDSADRRFAGVVAAIADRREPGHANRLALAMASIRDPRFIPAMIERLEFRHGRETVRDAFVALGPPAQLALERALRSAVTNPAVRLHIPRTLARFSNQRAADFLAGQLQVEPSSLVRYKVLRGLERVVEDANVSVDRELVVGQLQRTLVRHFEVTAFLAAVASIPRAASARGVRLLSGLLADKLEQSRERAFRLLHIAFRREDVRRLYASARSTDRRQRSNAMEFLDALAASVHDAPARRAIGLLALTVDELSLEQKLARATQALPARPGDRHAAFAMMIRDDDAALAVLATYAVRELGLDDLVAAAARAIHDREDASRHARHGRLVADSEEDLRDAS